MEMIACLSEGSREVYENIIYTTWWTRGFPSWKSQERKKQHTLDKHRLQQWGTPEGNLYFSLNILNMFYEATTKGVMRRKKWNSWTLSVECFETWGSLYLWPLTHAPCLRAHMKDAVCQPDMNMTPIWKDEEEGGERNSKRSLCNCPSFKCCQAFCTRWGMGTGSWTIKSFYGLFWN